MSLLQLDSRFKRFIVISGVISAKHWGGLTFHTHHTQLLLRVRYVMCDRQL